MFGLSIPFILQLATSVLSLFDHPSAKTAVQAIGEVATAVTGNEIPPEQVQAAQAAASQVAAQNQQALAQIAASEQGAELSADTTQAGDTTAIIQTEEKSEDGFVRRMRPFFGYTMAISWFVQMLSVSFVIFFKPALAPAIITQVGTLFPLWGIALAVLGIYVHRRSSEILAGKVGALVAGK